MSFTEYSFNSINVTVVGHYWSVPRSLRGWSLAAAEHLQLLYYFLRRRQRSEAPVPVYSILS
jgi:hypothetical protein